MSGLTNPAFEVDKEPSYKYDSKESELEDLENGRRKVNPDKQKRSISQGKLSHLTKGQNALEAYLSKHRRVVKIFFIILLNIAVVTYLGFASVYWRRNTSDCNYNWCDGYGLLLLIVGFTYAGIIYYRVVKRYFGRFAKKCWQPIANAFEDLRSSGRRYRIGRAIVYLLILSAIIVFLVLDTAGSRDRLISALGVVILMLLGWIFSKHPTHVDWVPVFWGLVLQFVFGLISIRWTVGKNVFQCISDKVVTFLNYAKNGANFMFSEPIVSSGVFAFNVLPVIFFFSFVIQILYYLGVMQWVVMKTGWILQKIMGTTLCESLIAIANPFLGMTESPLMIKPYISKLTSSELHSIMTSGFATVSGTVFAAYIEFGAQPIHLLTASIMSAPAALCYSKLFYPEMEESLTSFDNIQLEKSNDSGILDAATKGALAAVPIVVGIVANIIAFVSFIAFINGILSWGGGLVGYEHLSFELILSKVFMPLSWIMGVPWDDCEDVATLIGLKTIVNEFVAYQKLGEYKNQGKLGARSEAIATYALCGFSNPGSMGILVASLTALAPEKRQEIMGVTFRSFIAGSAVCFLTASIAGILMDNTFFGAITITTEVANTTTTSILEKVTA